MCVAGLTLFAPAHIFSQDLPAKVRGYKVYDARVSVTRSGDSTRVSDAADAVASLGAPRFTIAGLFDVAIEISAEITARGQSGQVEFMTFRDFRADGIAFEITEYRSPFKFEKGVAVSLPSPVHGAINLANIGKAAYMELTGSRKQWRVTGTVFVYGKFRKFGFSFKRVVPVRIDLLINNPLHL